MTSAIELRDLRYFEAIAELEHVGRAAERMHRSQPALTDAVRRLEAACSVPLFEKAGRGIRLTPAGRIMLKWAQRLRFDVLDATREMADVGRGLCGHIRIGIVPTAAQFLLPEAMRELFVEAPAVTVKVTVGLVDALKPMLHSGELDLVVGTEVWPEHGLRALVIAEDQIVVAASAQHEILKTRATIRDLTRYRWVLQSPGAATRDWLDSAFDRKRLPRPAVQVESNMLLMLPSMIAKTALLSFISRRHLAPAQAGADLREVRLRETTMQRKLVAMHREGGYVSPIADLLISHLARIGRREFA